MLNLVFKSAKYLMVLFLYLSLSLSLPANKLIGQTLGIGLCFFDVNGLNLIAPVNKNKNILETKIAWNAPSESDNFILAVDYLRNKPNYMRLGQLSFNAFYGMGGKWQGEHQAIAIRFPLGIAHNLEFAKNIQLSGSLVPSIPINLEQSPRLNISFAIRLRL